MQGLGGKDEVKVVYNSGVDQSKVSSHSVQVLRQIGAATGLSTITVSSTYRSSEKQIATMYSQTISKGSDAQFKLYGSKGDKVIQAQLDASKVEGATPEGIKAAMTEKATEVGFVSKHSSPDYESNNAIDLPLSSFSDEQLETIKTELGSIDPNASYIIEEDRNCLHLEIPTPNSETQPQEQPQEQPQYNNARGTEGTEYPEP